MKLIIISGRSGSGKSTALHVLEDLDFYCIDNLPVGLLQELGNQAFKAKDQRLNKIAISIDARNIQSGIDDFPKFYEALKQLKVEVDILYLDARSEVLLKRFNSTRRKHPLSSSSHSLIEAIDKESVLLEEISLKADLKIDTTNLSLYELRDLIKVRVSGKKSQELSVLFQSFGFKNGVPNDADFVFDVRCLPNPYWDPNLRSFSGLDEPVKQFLEAHPETKKMQHDITYFLEQWISHFEDSNRSYLTIAIGCTGGQHRSVYICEQIGSHFKNQFKNSQIRHKELSQTVKK